MKTDKHEFFLDIAMRCAHQGSCMRRNYGCVIVDQSGTIISTGYNGAPRRTIECDKTNHCWRKENNIPPGERYEFCNSVHAEQNALLQAGKLSRGATMYISGYEVDTRKTVEALPCFICTKMIVNAEIEKIYIRTGENSMLIYTPLILYNQWTEKLKDKKERNHEFFRK